MRRNGLAPVPASRTRAVPEPSRPALRPGPGVRHGRLRTAGRPRTRRAERMNRARGADPHPAPRARSARL